MGPIKKLVGQFEAAFRQKKPTTDIIFVLRNIIEKVNEKKEDVFVIYLHKCGIRDNWLKIENLKWIP